MKIDCTSIMHSIREILQGKRQMHPKAYIDLLEHCLFSKQHLTYNSYGVIASSSCKAECLHVCVAFQSFCKFFQCWNRDVLYSEDKSSN